WGEFGGPQVRHVQADDDRRSLAEPATGRRARNSEIHDKGHVPCGADEVSKPVVIALLRASRSRHEDDHRPSRSARSTALGTLRAIRRRETAAAVTTTRAETFRVSLQTALLRPAHKIPDTPNRTPKRHWRDSAQSAPGLPPVPRTRGRQPRPKSSNRSRATLNPEL